MKLILNCFCLVNLGSVLAYGQQSMDPEISGTSANHTLSWNSTSNYFYSVDCSLDLQSWTWTGIESAGTGNSIMYGFSSNAEKLFYRIRATVDSNDGGFLVLPQTNDEFDEIDGVCFAFDLNQFTPLPAKICLFEREYGNTSDQWEQIGMLTDFDEIDGIKFVRGSAVWLAKVLSGQNETEYEIQATVKDATGLIVASAIRQITVGKNQPPSVQITSGPTTPSVSAQPAIFAAIATDVDGDEVRRVEFYDNGLLIGADNTPDETSPGVFEFGDDITDIEGSSYDLLRGNHNITAKAYDSRGAVGETASASQYIVTGGNSRPTISVSSPSNGLVVTQGQAFTIAYAEGDPDGILDIEEVEVYDIVTNEGAFDISSPFTDLTIDTTGWDLGSHTLRVVVRDTSFDESYPYYLTIFVRAGTGATFAETLVANIVDETMAVPSNEEFFGVEASSGEFTLGLNSGLEIAGGALLTSGSFALWNGGDDAPQSSESTTETDDPNWGVDQFGQGDPILEDRVAGFNTSDAAVLEFDVFCSGGQLELVYQFGSEEYVEYVFDEVQSGCFNDAFIVTIDGVIVSLLPDCSDIVAVNSVHPAITEEESAAGCLDDDLDALNEHLYIDDGEIDAALSPTNQQVQVEYDGLTISLRIHAFVTPGLHRVRIAIADVYTTFDDDNFDSGIFLEEGSVRSLMPAP